MTDTTSTSVPTAEPPRKPKRPPELAAGQQIRMFRNAPTGVESTLVGAAQFDQHVADGWTLDDPAFIPHPDVVAAAADSDDGRILMQARFHNQAGQTKRVTPDEVAWHEQNGWSVA